MTTKLHPAENNTSALIRDEASFGFKMPFYIFPKRCH